jgi:hypothetical protein
MSQDNTGPIGEAALTHYLQTHAKDKDFTILYTHSATSKFALRILPSDEKVFYFQLPQGYVMPTQVSKIIEEQIKGAEFFNVGNISRHKHMLSNGELNTQFYSVTDAMTALNKPLEKLLEETRPGYQGATFFINKGSKPVTAPTAGQGVVNSSKITPTGNK